MDWRSAQEAFRDAHARVYIDDEAVWSHVHALDAFLQAQHEARPGCRFTGLGRAAPQMSTLFAQQRDVFLFMEKRVDREPRVFCRLLVDAGHLPSIQQYKLGLLSRALAARSPVLTVAALLPPWTAAMREAVDARRDALQQQVPFWPVELLVCRMLDAWPSSEVPIAVDMATSGFVFDVLDDDRVLNALVARLDDWPDGASDRLLLPSVARLARHDLLSGAVRECGATEAVVKALLAVWRNGDGAPHDECYARLLADEDGDLMAAIAEYATAHTLGEQEGDWCAALVFPLLLEHNRRHEAWWWRAATALAQPLDDEAAEAWFGPATFDGRPEAVLLASKLLEVSVPSAAEPLYARLLSAGVDANKNKKKKTDEGEEEAVRAAVGAAAALSRGAKTSPPALSDALLCMLTRDDARLRAAAKDALVALADRLDRAARHVALFLQRTE